VEYLGDYRTPNAPLSPNSPRYTGQMGLRLPGLAHSGPVLSTVTAMDWLKEMAAGWVRILRAAGDSGTPVDEAVRQIGVISEPTKSKGRLGRKNQEAEMPAVTVLSRQLVAGVIVSDLMLSRLCELAGQARDQVLDQLTSDLPVHLPDKQLRGLQDELSANCAPLQGQKYKGLSVRVDQLLRLAEDQAADIVAAARAEAAQIRAAARQ
jgi:hypothetical protein